MSRSVVPGVIALVVGFGFVCLLLIGKIALEFWQLREIPMGAGHSNPDLVVRVVSQQFSWQFHYPGPDGKLGRVIIWETSAENPLGLDPSDPASKDDFHSSELVLPCDALVQLQVTSLDVIHSLVIPQSRIAQDAIPGREMPMMLQTSSEPLSDTLRCGQLCGAGHDDHHAPYRFVSVEDFNAWISERPSAE